MKGLSLRYKLLAALTVIPILGLSLFLLLAVNIFEKDKIAYIFDSSLSVSKTRAARVSSEVSSVISMTQAIVLSYQSDTKSLASAGNYYFDREPKILGFQIYVPDPSGEGLIKAIDLNKEKVREVVSSNDQLFSQSAAKAQTEGLTLQSSDSFAGKLLLAARFGSETDPRRVIAVTFFDAEEVTQVFSDRGAYQTFLSHKTGHPVLMSENASWKQWSPEEIWSSLSGRNVPEGIAELNSPMNKKYLASYVDVGVANLVVVSMVDRGSALQAIDVLLKKSILFFIAILSFTTLIAVLASRGLTSALSYLSFATQKVAEGDFGVRVDIASGGEIGLLASSFNAMAEEVSRLMAETAEKARMESELATAKTVQETLFPENNAHLSGVQISGYYMPASECGGDWWFYCENSQKIYIWIGDATGHGAPAALLTSAARAVASVIQVGPPQNVSDSLAILNRAICETSKGRMMMTFFLACIDTQSGLMTYANASHEPPLLLHPMEGAPGRDDFEPLNDVNNPRLGEQIDCVFKEASVQLRPGDRIVFYTDGVVDVKNPEEKTWGERRFIKSLSREMSEAQDTIPALNGVLTSLQEFRNDTPLDDDVTLILCRYEGAA